MDTSKGSPTGGNGTSAAAALSVHGATAVAAPAVAGDAGDTVLLPDLNPRLCATITAIKAADDDIARLMAMGVCVGRKVELVQAGNPLILRVLGCRIGVSARLAEQVTVRPCREPACQPDNKPTNCQPR